MAFKDVSVYDAPMLITDKGLLMPSAKAMGVCGN